MFVTVKQCCGALSARSPDRVKRLGKNSECGGGARNRRLRRRAPSPPLGGEGWDEGGVPQGQTIGKSLSHREFAPVVRPLTLDPDGGCGGHRPARYAGFSLPPWIFEQSPAGNSTNDFGSRACVAWPAQECTPSAQSFLAAAL